MRVYDDVLLVNFAITLALCSMLVSTNYAQFKFSHNIRRPNSYLSFTINAGFLLERGTASRSSKSAPISETVDRSPKFDI